VVGRGLGRGSYRIVLPAHPVALDLLFTAAPPPVTTAPVRLSATL
jgi:hypothetical protein